MTKLRATCFETDATSRPQWQQDGRRWRFKISNQMFGSDQRTETVEMQSRSWKCPTHQWKIGGDQTWSMLSI